MHTLDNLSIKHWALEDRPREKLILKGKSTLSDAELIAILIGSGTSKISALELAKHILSSTGNNLNDLAKLSLIDLQKFNGIGEAKAVTIISALELGRRRKESDSQKRPCIRTARDTYDFIKPYLMDLDHEQFWVLFLNRANRLLKLEQISIGGVSGTLVDPKIIFKKAVEVLASKIILVHNHPSGNLRPSEQDVRLTKKIKLAGEALDIPVVDHVIFGDEGYFSFSDKYMMQ